MLRACENIASAPPSQMLAIYQSIVRVREVLQRVAEQQEEEAEGIEDEFIAMDLELAAKDAELAAARAAEQQARAAEQQARADNDALAAQLAAVQQQLQQLHVSPGDAASMKGSMRQRSRSGPVRASAITSPGTTSSRHNLRACRLLRVASLDSTWRRAPTMTSPAAAMHRRWPRPRGRRFLRQRR